MKGPFKKRFRPPFRGGGGGKPHRGPETASYEAPYLKRLADHQIPICVRLRDNQELRGYIEYYDHSFIRLTRLDAPNLFIFKREIKYIYEEGAGKARVASPTAAVGEPAEAPASETAGEGLPGPGDVAASPASSAKESVAEEPPPPSDEVTPPAPGPDLAAEAAAPSAARGRLPKRTPKVDRAARPRRAPKAAPAPDEPAPEPPAGDDQ